jgi:molecular chaperone GrpE (heat shock protein)
MHWLARIFRKQPPVAQGDGRALATDMGVADIAELSQKIARTQARQGLCLEEIESKLEAGFADLRRAIDKVGLAGDSSLSFDEVFDAMDVLEEAVRLAPDEAHAQGLRAVVDRLERFLKRAGFERQMAVGEMPDALRFRVVGTESSDTLAPGKALRIVRAAICRQGKLVREGEVIVSVRSI